jgi:DNA-binding MarR family transcriptional regulator
VVQEALDMQTDAEARGIALALEQVIRLHYSNSFRHGLKPAQWHALRYFDMADEGERTVTAFARHRASTMGTASTTISTLVRKGYLARSYGHGVPRNRGLHLTDKGRAMLSKDPIQAMVASLESLPASERSHLQHALDKLMNDLADTPEIAEAS